MVTTNTTMMPLGEATREFRQRTGRAVHPATLTRWLTVGVRRPGGSRVRLAGHKVGSRWTVSREAIDRFIAECNSPEPVIEPVAVVSPQASERRHRATLDDLKRRGAIGRGRS